jgi:hypothetical protein
MGEKTISQRHRPSVKSYIQQNIYTTFAITEKAELMVALGLILFSAILGLIGGLSAPIINDILAPWQLRLSIGLVVFIIVQFLIITPFRMWRKAVWVANIELLLEQLWDSHDEGVKLLNAHVEFVLANPDFNTNNQKVNDWVSNWFDNVNKWTEDTQGKLSKLYPIEARRFKHVVTYENKLRDNLDIAHGNYRNMLLRRLEMLSNVIEKHQPKLLPD